MVDWKYVHLNQSVALCLIAIVFGTIQLLAPAEWELPISNWLLAAVGGLGGAAVVMWAWDEWKSKASN